MRYVGYSTSRNHRTGEDEICSLYIGTVNGNGFKTEAAARRAGMAMMGTKREKDIVVSPGDDSGAWYWRPANQKLWRTAIQAAWSRPSTAEKT